MASIGLFCHKNCDRYNPQKSAIVKFGPDGSVARLWQIPADSATPYEFR